MSLMLTTDGADHRLTGTAAAMSNCPRARRPADLVLFVVNTTYANVCATLVMMMVATDGADHWLTSAAVATRVMMLVTSAAGHKSTVAATVTSNCAARGRTATRPWFSRLW
jgi:hypothetical protein